jgi:hypothetical protein
MANWNLRFQRRVKVAPGLRLVFSRSGVSTTIGPQGAHINVGPRGIRQTIGLPGTGLWATKLTPFPKHPDPPPPEHPHHPVHHHHTVHHQVQTVSPLVIVGGFVAGVVKAVVTIFLLAFVWKLLNGQL